MSLHLIQSETLKNIADEVRALACTSEALTLTEMIDNLCDSNTECATQCDLIAQIQAELEGKAAGGSSGKFETVNGQLSITSPVMPMTCLYYMNENGEVEKLTCINYVNSVAEFNPTKGLLVSYSCNFKNSAPDGVELLFSDTNTNVYKILSDFSFTI